MPEYSGEPYCTVNGGVPYFCQGDLKTAAYERYGDLDSLGRCTATEACLCRELMPEDERGPIGMVRPSGWRLDKYDFVDGKYLYNRCHLIGYQLTGENANECNLITGTRYLNVQGMLPFENRTAQYIRQNGGHVMYRVTPIFNGNELHFEFVLFYLLFADLEGFFFEPFVFDEDFFIVVGSYAYKLFKGSGDILVRDVTASADYVAAFDPA